ncbi:MAG: 1-phosphofructokinase [Clostridia bacterium]|nr:1-phosphofructokinase [Clostridia bacterium]
MIYTVTLNPSLDYYINVGDLKIGETNRSKGEEVVYGGKGINVSVMLTRLGIPNIAMGFAAGFTGKKLLELLSKEDVHTDFVILDEGNTRINVKIKGKDITEINAGGPKVSDDKLLEFKDKLKMLKDGDTFVLSGTIPGSMPSNIYEEIVSIVSKKNVNIVIDATKEVLEPCLKFAPFLIKPNKSELEEIVGRRLDTIDEAVEAARMLVSHGARNVLASLGKDGAILLSEEGEVYYKEAVGGKAVNTVGAGDSMIAGFLAGLNNGTEYAFNLSIASGGASATAEYLATKDDIFLLL